MLEFPTLARFRKEAAKGYDIIGIGAIVPNFMKVKKMVEEARAVAPRTKIVIGGFCASIVRICTGEVCVRNTSFSFDGPGLRKNVSCISRAGWSGGKLSAVKL